MKFSKNLTRWYSVNKRSLPWRSTRDPYLIWLSEIILQQTRVNQGLSYYENFVEHFPTVFDLASASEERVLKLWQGLGYYSRARNLHVTAKYIVDHNKGVFPDSYRELIKLKGVGDYTASAIASICYNEKCAVVDGNVYRVLSRVFGIETPINSTVGIKEFKALAQRLLPKAEIGDYNQAIMEFGKPWCKPKNPICKECVLSTNCIAFQTNKIAELPVKTKKLKVSKRYLNFLVVLSENEQILLEKREANGIWKNLYQFPLIETERSHTKKELIANQDFQKIIQSEFSISLYNASDIVHKLSHQHLYTKFWIVKVKVHRIGGIDISDLRKYPVPILIANFIEEFQF